MSASNESITLQVYQGALGTLKKKIKTLNRRLERSGNEQRIEIDVGEKRFKNINIGTTKDPAIVNVPVCPVTINHPFAQPIEGYRLIADIKKDKATQAWQIHYLAQDAEGDPAVPFSEIKQLDPCQCDHCGNNRKRSKIALLEEVKTGKVVQVGSSCIDDFVDHSMVALMQNANAFYDSLLADMNKDPESPLEGMGLPGFSGIGETAEEIMAIAFQAIQSQGQFVSRSAFEEFPELYRGATADEVVRLDREVSLGGRVDIYDRFMLLAQLACEHWQTIEAENNFEFNVQSVIESGLAGEKKGLLAAAAHIYLLQNPDQAQVFGLSGYEAKENESWYHQDIEVPLLDYPEGHKWTAQDPLIIELHSIKETSGFRGALAHKVWMATEDGARLFWKNSGSMQGMTLNNKPLAGARFQLTGTLSKQLPSSDIPFPFSKLTRCKLTIKELAGPAQTLVDQEVASLQPIDRSGLRDITPIIDDMIDVLGDCENFDLACLVKPALDAEQSSPEICIKLASRLNAAEPLAELRNGIQSFVQEGFDLSVCENALEQIEGYLKAIEMPSKNREKAITQANEFG